MATRMNPALLLLLRRLIIVPSMLLIAVFCIWTLFGLAAFTTFSYSRSTTQGCKVSARRWGRIALQAELDTLEREAYSSSASIDGFGRSTKSSHEDPLEGWDGDTVAGLEVVDSITGDGDQGVRKDSLLVELRSLGFSDRKEGETNARRQMVEISSDEDEEEDDDIDEDDRVDENQLDSKVIEDGLLRIMDSLRQYPSTSDSLQPAGSGDSSNIDACSGKWIYSYKLPAKFNDDLVALCDHILPWFSMCDYFENSGMGKLVTTDSSGVLRPSGRWHKTNQYMLEVLFHARLKEYGCLTDDPSKAQLFHIPYYGGLDVSRYHYANVSYEQKDELGWELIDWLEQHESWRRHGGRDHFLVLGKITWDFRRTDTEWGNTLLMNPGLQNVTRLLLERDPWDENDIGVPHPTYFHPTSDSDMVEWLQLVSTSHRAALFSFAGMPRATDTIRSILIRVCASHPKLCRFLECAGDVCLRPESTMSLFLDSEFCLQPVGDSATRRSVFDSLIAGCIPVLFSQETAYVQYPWHLPRRLSDYSVFIAAAAVKSGAADIAEVLSGISPARRRRMRARVVAEVIPRLVYAAPAANLSLYRHDAFHVSIAGLLERSKARSALL